MNSRKLAARIFERAVAESVANGDWTEDWLEGQAKSSFDAAEIFCGEAEARRYRGNYEINDPPEDPGRIFASPRKACS